MRSVSQMKLAAPWHRSHVTTRIIWRHIWSSAPCPDVADAMNQAERQTASLPLREGFGAAMAAGHSIVIVIAGSSVGACLILKFGGRPYRRFIAARA